MTPLPPPAMTRKTSDGSGSSTPPVSGSRFCCSPVCDKVTIWFEGGAIAAAAAGTLTSLVYYNSYALAFCCGIPGVGCGLALLYIQKYRSLRPLNELTADVDADAARLASTARRVNTMATDGFAIGKNLADEDEKTGIELGRLAQSNEERAKGAADLRISVDSVSETNRALQAENAQLKTEIASLKQQLATFSRQLESFQKQNSEFESAVGQLGIQVDRLSSGGRQMSPMSDDLESSVHSLDTNLEETLAKQQALFITIKSKIEDLNQRILELGQIERRLSEQIAEKRRIEEEFIKLKEEFAQLKQLQTLTDRIESAMHRPPEEEDAERRRMQRIEDLFGEKKP